MTDDQRFKLDAATKQRHAEATADLSRLQQQARDHGIWLERIGQTLKESPHTTHIYQPPGGATWKWVAAPMGQEMMERALPTWEEINALTGEIRSLQAELRRLEVEMRSRGLA